MTERAGVDETHFRKLENLYHAAPTNEYFRPRLRVAKGEAEIVMPVREAFFHAAHAVHGSTYFKALDDAAFFAVNSLVPDVFVLTVTFDLQMLRPVADGALQAMGRVVHASRRL